MPCRSLESNTETLDYVSCRHCLERGLLPSFEEIAEHFGHRSGSQGNEHLSNLERKGYIRRGYNESRAIEVRPPRGSTGASEIPLLGLVAAGFPIESMMSGEVTSVPDTMLPRRGPNYALRVRGESMVDEQIRDGDLVVVNGRDSADNGEMVIALVNGAEATVKRFYREPGGWISASAAGEHGDASIAVPGTRRADPGRRGRSYPEVLTAGAAARSASSRSRARPDTSESIATSTASCSKLGASPAT